MRKKKALLNTSFSLILQLVTIISSFIVPLYIITNFGSDVNGVVISITQFLSYISLLEAGMGGVVRATLYKPLAQKNIVQISKILKTTQRFFKKMAYAFLLYVLIIAVIYPKYINTDFENLYTTTLILIIGISSFVQYYFGITYSLLLQADQRRYITSIFQIITIIINTFLVVILIRSGFGIHLVMLGSATIFVVRPILLQFYVKKRYKINYEIESNNNVIEQRWDGLGHHIAYFLHRNTDVVVLTVFTNLREVSVYYIYYMVVTGIQKIVNTLSSGIEAAFGNMIAKGEKVSLEKNFRLFEFISFTATTVLFTSASILIMSFIAIYTSDFSDANYYRPLFAYVLIAAEAVYCIRLPYQAVVLAAGHFKQTKSGAYIEVIINILLSIILVNFLGLLGVAIATLVSMLYRTIYYAVYLSRNILNRRFIFFVKRIIVSLSSVMVTIALSNLFSFIEIHSYYEWIIFAIIVTILSSLVISIFSVIFYLSEVKSLIEIVKRAKMKK